MVKRRRPTPEPKAFIARWAAQLEHRLVYTGAYTHRVPPAPTPAAYGQTFGDLTLITEDGVRLHAWALHHHERAPWLVYLHGQGENIGRYLPVTVAIAQLGYNVLTVDYRGYGLSEGTPSEAGLYLDARACLSYLRERGVASARTILYGYSLGSGVAAQTALTAPVAALVLEAAYVNLPTIARSLYKVVPTSILRQRFDTLSKIAAVEVPTAFLHAPNDLLVPYAHGRTLYACASGKKVFIDYQGGHPGLLERRQPEVFERLATFLDQHLKRA